MVAPGSRGGSASWFLKDYDIFTYFLFKRAVIDLKVVDAYL